MAKKIKQSKNELDSKGFKLFKPMPKSNIGEFSVFDIEDDLKKMYGVKEQPTSETTIQPIMVKQKTNVDKKGFRMLGNMKRSSIQEAEDELLRKQQLQTQIQAESEVEKNKRCGSIDRFDNYLKAYIHSKSDFVVVSYGTTKKLICGRYSSLFNGIKGEKKPQGLHLISLVKKDIDSYIQNGGAIPKIPKDKPYLTFINYQNLYLFGEGEQALGIDINHCYWRTIYLQGVITDETYQKGIENPDYRDGRLIAVGTLGKKISVTKYRDGEKVDEFIDDRDYIKYGGFFWQVLSKIYDLMLDLYNSLGKDFLMFLTDCIIIKPSRKADAIAIMEKHGYSTKEYGMVFTAIEDNKVAWINDKGEHKHIIHNKLLGEK